MNELLSEKIGPGKLVLSISNDRVELYVSWLPHDAHELPALKLEDLTPLLEKARISVTEERRGLLDRSLALMEGFTPPIVNYLLLSGQAPVPGQPAIIWKVDPGTGKSEDDGLAAFDPYSVQRFINVNEGETVCELVTPVKTVDGVDVYGQVVHGPEIDDKPVKPGQGMILQPDGRTCVAQTSGAIHFKEGAISVQPLLEIKGDVNFKVGHIKFNGTVQIRGTILDNFNVSATKDVFVSGNIEASRVEVGGALVVNGGITGHLTGTIKAGGTVKAKYINSATVESLQEVLVSTEIISSRIRAGTKLVAERGALVGGNANAGELIRCAVLGSKMGQLTRVAVGSEKKAEHKPMMNVLRRLYSNVNMKIGARCQMLTVDEKTGPLLIKEDEESPGLIQML